MQRPGKLGLVVLILLALVVSQFVSWHTGPSATGVHASGNISGSGAQSSSPLVDTATATVAATQTAVATATQTAVAGSSATPTSTTPPFFPTQTPTPLAGQGLTITPPSGAPGATVTISAIAGSFPSLGQVGLYFTDPLPGSVPVSIGTAAADYLGSLNATNIKLPPSATYGVATITARAANGAAVTGQYVVTAIITPNPSTVAPGGTVQITGDGFAAANTIRFVLNGADVTANVSPSPVTTDHSGHFLATLTVPASQPVGTGQLQASDSVHYAFAPLSISTTPVGSVTGTVTVTTTVTQSAGTPTLLPTAPPVPRSPTAIPVVSPTRGTGGGSTTAYFAEGYTGTAKVNGKANFNEVLSILNPNSVAVSVTITYYIQGQSTPQVVTRVVPASSTLRENVNNDVGLDKLASAIVTAPQRVHVVRTISRTTPTGGELDGSTTQPATAPATVWNFAEGYTGVTFQEYLTILNPSNAQASITLRLAPQAANSTGARTLSFTVPPLSRSTKDIRALNAGGSAASVGMLINSSQPIVPERVMYFGDGSGSGKFGSTVTSGLQASASQLRLGYGVSGGSAPAGNGTVQPVGDQDFITLLNPSANGSAHVTIGFTDVNGHSVATPTTVDVPAGTRRTVIANTALGTRAVGPFSASLAASGNTIQAEAAQYFGGSPNIGTHPGIALPALGSPSVDVFLADLSTKLADGTPINRSVYLYNPNGTSEQITATYFSSSGSVAHAVYTVGAGGITTVNVNHDVPVTFGAGPIGAEFRVSSGSFTATAVGRSTNNLAAFEEVGAAS